MQNQFALVPKNEINYPIPAVVIAVGEFGVQVARQVQHIYLRGNARRNSSSSFFELKPDNKGDLELKVLTEKQTVDSQTAKSQTPSESFFELRNAAQKAAVENGLEVKTQLEKIFHEQRVHERLIAAGWSDSYDVPLNFFILADLNDPWSAGVLLPLASILNDMLMNSNMCQVHWLLNTAVFPDSPPNQDLAVWSSLQTFDEFLRPESKIRDRLSEALSLQNNQTPDFAVYLFDNRKAGSALVKDRNNLAIIVGNALLALLQDDLARRLFRMRDEDARFEHGSFYSSVGATAIVYDPDALQMACAKRIGYSFLSETLMGTSKNEQAAIQFSTQLQEKIGEINQWSEDLSAPLVPAIGQMRFQKNPLKCVALITDLDIPTLDYQHVNQTPWAENFQNYDIHFQNTTLPIVTDQLKSYKEEFQKNLLEILENSLDNLPLETDLYPGGLDNANSVLELISKYFNNTNEELDSLMAKIQEKQPIISKELEIKIQDMQVLLSEAPELHRWARILPAFIRKWMAPFVMTRQYGKEIFLAINLRNEGVELLQQLCGLRVQLEVLARLKEIMPFMLAGVKESQDDLEIFKKKLALALGSFSKNWGNFPLASGQNGWEEIFRKPVADISLSNWTYNKWSPDLDTWVQEFVKAPPIGEWRNAKAKSISAWVTEKSARTYQPVWEIDLDSIFGLWVEKKPGFTNSVILNSKTIRSCMSTAIPLIRPNFDAVGNSNGSSVSFHGLIGSQDWKYCCLPSSNNGMDKWQYVQTGDPFTSLFIQVHHNFPLASLIGSFQSVKFRLDRLEEKEKLTYLAYSESLLNKPTATSKILNT